MNAALSQACPSCERLTGRLCRLIPVERAIYRAVQRCDLCGHRWTSIIPMESDRFPGVTSAGGPGDASKA